MDTTFPAIAQRINSMLSREGREPVSGAGVEEIAAAEAEAGVKFPEELVAWLLCCRGVDLEGAWQIYGVDPRSGMEIPWLIRTLAEHRPKQWIPVAGDPFGCHFCIVTDASPPTLVGFSDCDDIGTIDHVVATRLDRFLALFMIMAERNDELILHDRDLVLRIDPDLEQLIGYAYPWDED